MEPLSIQGTDWFEHIRKAFRLNAQDLPLAQLVETDTAVNKLNELRAESHVDLIECMEAYDEEFAPRFVCESIALEGSTLALGKVQLACENAFLPATESELRELFAAKGSFEGYGVAVAEIRSGKVLDEQLVKKIHRLTALDIPASHRGAYRKVDVCIARTPVAVARPDDIQELMSKLFEQHAASGAHPLVKDCAFHALFEAIHPFRDGNGRTGRIVLNAMLESSGCPPIVIRSEERQRYIEGLQAWQIGDDPEPFVSLVCEHVEKEAQARIAALETTRKIIPIIEKERAERMRKPR